MQLKEFISSIILWIGAIVLYVLGALLAIGETSASSVTCFSFGTILLFMANLERLEYFKGFGLEAKTRKLDEKIDEANHLLEKLKSLSRISGPITLNLACGFGKWGASLSKRQIYKIKNEIAVQLRSVGLQESEINEAIEPWVKMSGFDLAIKATEELKNEFFRLRPEANDEQKAAVEAFEPRLINMLHLIPITDLRLTIEKMFCEAPLIDPEKIKLFRINALPSLEELSFLINKHDLPKNSLLLVESD